MWTFSSVDATRTDTHAHRASHPWATWQTKKRKQTEDLPFLWRVKNRCGTAVHAYKHYDYCLQCSRSRESSDFLQKRRNRVQLSCSVKLCILVLTTVHESKRHAKEACMLSGADSLHVIETINKLQRKHQTLACRVLKSAAFTQAACEWKHTRVTSPSGLQVPSISSICCQFYHCRGDI